MKKLIISVIGFIAIVYLVTLKGSFGNNTMVMNIPPFETSMERGRFAQAVALAEHGTYTVDRFRDFLRPDIAWYNGHYYPAFPPGVSTLAAIGYSVGRPVNMGQLFSTLPTMLASLLTALIIIQICQALELGATASCLAAIVFGLATGAFPYSVSLSAHPFSAIVTAIMFLLYLKIRKNPHNHWLLFSLWLTYGTNLFIDYPNLAITAPLVILPTVQSVFLHANKVNSRVTPFTRLLFSASGLVIALLPFFAFNYLHYGKFLAFTNTYNLKRLSIQGVPFSENSLTNGLFAQKNYSGRFAVSQIPDGLYTLLFSQDRGLFIYSPVLIFLFIGMYFLFKTNKAAAWLIAIVFFVDLVIYGSFDDPWGGWGFGPRYLIVSLPLLAVLVGAGYDRLVQKVTVLKYIFFILLIISIGINLSGALTTNAVPPGVEAVGLHMKDNFLFNLDYLTGGSTSSFVYNQLLAGHETPIVYGLSLLAFITIGLLSLPWRPGKKYEA